MMFSQKSGTKKPKLALPLSIFEKARRPKKRKMPHIHKPPKNEVLIDVKALALPCRRAETPQDFEHLDKLLLKLPEEKQPEMNMERPGAPAGGPRKRISLAVAIMGLQNRRVKAEKTRNKYKHLEFPLPLSKKELKRRTEQHLDLVPALLAGKEKLSIFYNLASDQRKRLPHLTMSPAETFDSPWHQYIAGFYGLSRQNFISLLIQYKYAALLKKSRNKTVLYWSPDMFATYVLANEIVIRLVMEDLQLSKVDTEKLLRETSDYGSDVADEIELVDDLEYGEPDFLADHEEKGQTGEERLDS